MPPRKKARGPLLSPVKEDASVRLKTDKPSTSESAAMAEKVAADDDELDALENAAIERETEAAKQPTPAVKAPTSASNKRKNAELTLRENVTSSIRQAFQAKSGVSEIIKHSANQLLNAYKKTTKAKTNFSADVFFNELDIRLCMIIEALTIMESRVRVMKSVCEAACKQVVNNEGTAILDFLVNKFFAIWLNGSESEQRTNITTFVGLLFESGITNAKQGQFACFDMTYVRKLYGYVLTSRRDKCVTVRNAASRAASILQKCDIPVDFVEAVESSPTEVLIKAFRDIAPECRLPAIDIVIPGSHMVQDIIQLALSDKSLKVRNVALRRFGELSFRAVSRQQKLQLLYTCLNDHELSIRESVKRYVIEVWLARLIKLFKKLVNPPKQDNSDVQIVDASGNALDVAETRRIAGHGNAAFLTLHFFDLLSVESKPQIRFIIMQTLDTVRYLYNLHHEPIDLLIEAMVDDLVDEEVAAKKGFVQFMHRKTLVDVLLSDIDVETRLELMVFHRILIEYCVDRAKDSNDAIFAIERLTPKMVQMCDLVRNVLIVFEKDEQKQVGNDEALTNMRLYHSEILQNLLLTFRHFDKEQSGMAAWKSLLEDILYNIDNRKALVDIVVQDLAEFFYNDTPTLLLSDVASSISDMLNRVTTSDQTMVDETVFIGTSKPKQVTSADRAKLIAITDYELLLFNSILKTGILTKFETILKTKYETLVLPKLTSTVMDERIVAMECVGVIGMIDLESIRNQLHMCREIAENDAYPVQSTYFAIITDLCVTYGIDCVENFMYSTSAATTTPRGKRRVNSTSTSTTTSHIVESMCNVILTDDRQLKNSEVALRCCESLGKLLLHENHIDPESKTWHLALIALLSRLNYKLEGGLTIKIRSVITALLTFFSSLSVVNQKCIIKCFKPFYTEWDRNPTLVENAGAHEFIYDRLRRCAAVFTKLTRHSLILPEKRMMKRPAHFYLLEDAFKELSINSESSASNYYSAVMDDIEVESFDRSDLAIIIDNLQDVIDIYEGDDPKNRGTDMKKLLRRANRLLGTKERGADRHEHAATAGGGGADSEDQLVDVEIKEEPLDEEHQHRQPSTPEADQPVVKKRATRASAKKVAVASTSKASAVQELRALVDSPVREIVAKKSSKPASEARPKRAAARRL